MKTIPKICHLYWDRSPMALLQVFTVTSFHRYNPDWHIIVYLTKQLPDLKGEKKERLIFIKAKFSSVLK